VLRFFILSLLSQQDYNKYDCTLVTYSFDKKKKELSVQIHASMEELNFSCAVFTL